MASDSIPQSEWKRRVTFAAEAQLREHLQHAATFVVRDCVEMDTGFLRRTARGIPILPCWQDAYACAVIRHSHAPGPRGLPGDHLDAYGRWIEKRPGDFAIAYAASIAALVADVDKVEAYQFAELPLSFGRVMA